MSVEHDLSTVPGSLESDGVVHGLPHADYLAHPALSASGAKVLVRPGGPARYQYEREHPRPASDAMDLGSAAHLAVLGVGPVLEVVLADDWRTAAARQQRDAARAAGRVAILERDAHRVADMAQALRTHRLASRLLDPSDGSPEVSLFWTDPEYGVQRRGRLDWLREPNAQGRLLLVDYKTTQSADPAAIRSAVLRFGYHQQAAWYRDLAVGLGLARTAPFLFVFQETTAPYLVHVAELDDELIELGATLNRLALDTFARCTAAGSWPGYGDEPTLIDCPPWAWRDVDAEVAP